MAISIYPRGKTMWSEVYRLIIDVIRIVSFQPRGADNAWRATGDWPIEDDWDVESRVETCRRRQSRDD